MNSCHVLQEEFPQVEVLLARDVRVLRDVRRSADEDGGLANPRLARGLAGAIWRPEHLRERERESVLTQWGATLVIQLRERERERAVCAPFRFSVK